MKKLKYFILGLVGALSWSLYSCQNDDVVDPETNGSEELFTVTEVPAMKGSVSTPILDGTGTYKTGKHVTVKAKAGATISGFLKSGSGTIGNTYQSGGFACADIDDIHGDWSVSATVETAKITFNAGTGGSIGSPSFVEGEIGESKTGPTATANTGYSFDKWSDGCTSATWSGTISSTDRTVTAKFVTTEKKKYSISITESPSEFSYLGSGPWYHSPQTNRDGSGTIEEGGAFSITLYTPSYDNNGNISVRIASATCNGKAFSGSYSIPSVKNNISISIKYEYYDTRTGETVPSPIR